MQNNTLVLMVLIWQVVYITFEMTTTWYASGIFTRRKPKFFLTNNGNDLEYFTSL